jgi:amidase
MNLEEYSSYDATGLARLIEKGDVSADEVASAALEAVRRTNGRLNALAGPLFEEPLACRRDGPFAGVPFLIKDLVLHAEGVPTSWGSRLADGLSFPHDTELMKRFRNAGLAAVGRTTVPEFGLNSSTESALYGATQNPWKPGRTPGGSSGGSAAMVAAGAVPVAHANDGGGSIRIPAALCGLVGLKPSRGRIPVGPDMDIALAGLGVEFVVTRSVRDAAKLLELVSGFAPGDFIPVPPLRLPSEQRPRRLRIAWSLRPEVDVPIDPDVLRGFSDTLSLLRDLGHELVESDPPFDRDQLFEMMVTIWSGFLANIVFMAMPALGRAFDPARLEASSLACAEHGRRLAATDLFQAEGARNLITRAVCGWFEPYDVLLTPTTAAPAWSLGVNDGSEGIWDAHRWVRWVFEYTPFTALWNVTGLPAISLPLATSSDGLPIGMQFVAPWGREDTLVDLAYELEASRPWTQRRPEVHVSRL